MIAAAYCRVSTNKDEQLESLGAQRQFFSEYAKKNSYQLIKIYADEGKSGTNIKNRKELQKLLSDANSGVFELVLIKDISRLARNTVDFLTSIRKLKALGIKVVFVNYDQTSSESSEFMLTMLSAIAQEESAGTSRRVKFGKRLNAEKGRVPNFVYGYDKISGDYFNLNINGKESETVKRIFNMYINQNIGANRIALELNRDGITTKRGNKWSQNAITRILSNKIYTGRIINCKEEVEDFLTGKRKQNCPEKQLTVNRPELRIISDDDFEKAQKIISSRKNAFFATGERCSDMHVFSKMIKCSCCGYSFRRSVRSYKNIYVKWVCQGRNANGAESCPNNTIINENELLDLIKAYFANILADKPGVIQSIMLEFKRKYNAKDVNVLTENQIVAQLEKAKKTRLKYIEMYDMEIITITELKQKSAEINAEIGRLTTELKLIQTNMNKADALEAVLKESFNDLHKIIKSTVLTSNLLKRVINSITADEHGNIDIYLKLLSDIGLEKDVLTHYY